MNIRLSILICSTHTRSDTFLPVMMKRIFGLYEILPLEHQEEVEIIVLVDNKKIMLGAKRNEMVDLAQGEYIVFVDDDDRISDNYISSLLTATRKGKDVITFQAEVSVNNEAPKICFYNKDWECDFNEPDYYYRIPNHICCVKRVLAIKTMFPLIAYGEDAGYSKELKKRLKTQTVIDEVLYFYDFNSETTETQQHLNIVKRERIKKGNPYNKIFLNQYKS